MRLFNILLKHDCVNMLSIIPKYLIVEFHISFAMITTSEIKTPWQEAVEANDNCNSQSIIQSDI